MTVDASTAISIREVEGIKEMREVEELRKEVWGMGDRDVVPVMNLIAVKESGGKVKIAATPRAVHHAQCRAHNRP